MPLRAARAPGAVCLALTALLISACGEDDEEESKKPTTMSITTTDLGKKKFKMVAPKSIEGGVVNVRFHNAGKIPHEAQLLRLDDGHTAEEALKVVSAEKVVLPDWFHAEGGPGTAAPGKTATATVKLAPGDYAVLGGTDSEDGPPPAQLGARASFRVTGDNGAKLEEKSVKVETKDKGHHKFEFVASGLKSGTNDMTFDNPSKEIHHVIAFPILGKATLADVKKYLATEGKASGPPPVDFEKGDSTAVLDGKRKENVKLKLTQGRVALVCFLKDRNGKGKPHFQEGMLKEVDLK